MFRSNSTSVVRLDSTLSGTYTATTAGGTSAESTAAPISGGLPRSPTPQSAEMDALLKEKPSMDQHDLEANPTGKPEAEGPAGADAKVRRHMLVCILRYTIAFAFVLGFPFVVPFGHGLFVSHVSCRLSLYGIAIQYIHRAEEA